MMQMADELIDRFRQLPRNSQQRVMAAIRREATPQVRALAAKIMAARSKGSRRKGGAARTEAPAV